MATIKVRCPSCGRKRLRVRVEDTPREDQVCRICAEELARMDGQNSPMRSAIAFRPAGGITAQEGRIWQNRGALVRDEAFGPQDFWLKPGCQLPF